MKKESAKKHTDEDNSFGVSSTLLGLLSLLLSIALPFQGFVLGIIGLVFANKQKNKQSNSWAKAGKILSIIGIVVSVILLIAVVWLAQNPQLLRQLGAPNVP